MKFTLNQLIASEISNETAFQLVKFTRDLSLALESMYFDQILHHTSVCEHDPFATGTEEDPF